MEIALEHTRVDAWDVADSVYANLQSQQLPLREPERLELARALCDMGKVMPNHARDVLAAITLWQPSAVKVDSIDTAIAMSGPAGSGAVAHVNVHCKQFRKTFFQKATLIRHKDKNGTFIGARMGRPEKAKQRKLLGKLPDSFESSIAEFLHPDDAPKIKKYYEGILSGKLKTVECRRSEFISTTIS